MKKSVTPTLMDPTKFFSVVQYMVYTKCERFRDSFFDFTFMESIERIKNFILVIDSGKKLRAITPLKNPKTTGKRMSIVDIKLKKKGIEYEFSLPMVESLKIPNEFESFVVTKKLSLMVFCYDRETQADNMFTNNWLNNTHNIMILCKNTPGGIIVYDKKGQMVYPHDVCLFDKK